MKYTLSLLVVVGIIALFGCIRQEQKGKVYGYENLLEDLRAKGTNVEVAGEIEQVFFSVKGKVIKVNGEDVQVFEYNSEDEANLQAGLVSRDGSSVGTSMISWIDEPHFYEKGKIIVIYIGQNPTIKELLSSIFGEQFAGW